MPSGYVPFGASQAHTYVPSAVGAALVARPFIKGAAGAPPKVRGAAPQLRGLKAIRGMAKVRQVAVGTRPNGA